MDGANPFDLTGKVAIVTGGNGGLGLGMASGLARAGARVAIAARRRDKAEAAITALDAERSRLSAGTGLNTVLDSTDPVAAFDGADLGTRRSVIRALCTVHVHAHPRGRKGFNPSTVTITPRAQA